MQSGEVCLSRDLRKPLVSLTVRGAVCVCCVSYVVVVVGRGGRPQDGVGPLHEWTKALLQPPDF